MCLRGDTSDGLLVELYEHATGLHVGGQTLCDPNTIEIHVEYTRAAPVVPPAATVHGAVATPVVVVAVQCSEHHSVRDLVRSRMTCHGIAGVTAVPSHRQTILTDLITDGERRVFSPVPQTISTLDLQIVKQNSEFCQTLSK